MSDRQLDLIMQIVKEQLEDYLAQALVEDLCNGIREGIYSNLELLDQLAEG